MEGTIRKAEPRDAVEMAKLYYMAGRSHVELSIHDLIIPGPPGMTDERIGTLAKVIAAETVSWMSYVYYKVVEVDGKVASGRATFTVEQYDDRQVGGALMEAGWQVKDLMELVKRLEVWEATDTGRVPDYLIVEHVATFEEFRGRGYTGALLERAGDEAARAGLKGLQLTVLLGNEPAIRVYEKAGFRMDITKENPDFERLFAAPGVGRMLLDLG
ncbi:MAG: GNAT family N-acetyltransferase [Actinobacteria bacterium]|nr:GNAT family N-acetyltransferase [Actinomycetota bacterium]MBU1943677.1 GNAT family N-acetyltransferase [Actinomycetota bacterium]MBU2686179.1 GNAT family N-acetyltransferase [Actinomycetota bacterium]